MEIFEYDFMRKAFLVGIMLAVIIPCIGIVVVLKRLSMMGDALSHTSLAGVTFGLVFNINPIAASIIFCILSALSIEFIRKKISKYSEMSISIIMSASVSIAGILSGFVQNNSNFNSFLFGSIVAISDFELKLIILISSISILIFILLYKEIFYIAFNERLAKLSGVPVSRINFIFTILTAVTVSISARTIGALIVSSMMVVPIACSMQIADSYKKTIIYAVLFNLFFTVSGIFISYYKGLKPGAAIVLISIISFIIIILFKSALSSKHNKNFS
ncbi:metal ABC transporter permease [uncultured Brachyspira sp.]|uniref:metal ABC transporter permease n=1 Tax=uncultured Brachyspira sp. TaxID=221953 RepID=UPI0025F2B87F|nr:metal ABC transporter permease [uncultured Brachyspira sp.]